jgi:hypothetical protein
MVLAVNWPGQAPKVGIAARSIASSSSAAMAPVSTAPAAS